MSAVSDVQLNEYLKGIEIQNQFLSLRKPEWWFRNATYVAAIVSVVWEKYALAIALAVGLFVIDLLNFRRNYGSMATDGLPPNLLRRRMRQLIKKGQLTDRIGNECVDLLEKCAGYARKITHWCAMRALSHRSDRELRDEMKRITDAVQIEMDEAIGIVGKSITFKLPPDDNAVSELRRVSENLARLSTALDQEAEALSSPRDASLLTSVLNDFEAREAARQELDQGS